jgi:hypothetical protein
MAELKSIEQLLYFMKSHVHLSRYDEKFIDNISILNTVTTNQVVLFHRLIFKYRRQFAKHELFVEKLVDLPWNVTVVESSHQYTDGHVSIIADMIYLRCPFNKNFIDEFRKVPLNSFVWNKEKRLYEASYSTYNLKILLNTATKFFPIINNCSITQSLLDEIKPFEDAQYWQPTLVKRNGNLYIVAINEPLNEALGEMTLAEDITTFKKLSSRGVHIDSSFYDNDKKLKFVCEAITEVEQSDTTDMVKWLKEIKCQMVYLVGGGSINLIKKKVIELLTDAQINYCDTSITVIPKSNPNQEYPILIKFKKNFETDSEPVKVSKVVYLVNSSPIEIK